MMSEEDRNRCSALTAALELRFGDEHLRHVFAGHVKTRTQKIGESLQEFEAHVKRLILQRTTNFSREACDRNLGKWHSRR